MTALQPSSETGVLAGSANPAISLEPTTLILKELRNSASCTVNGLGFFSEWVPVRAVIFSNAASPETLIGGTLYLVGAIESFS